MQHNTTQFSLRPTVFGVPTVWGGTGNRHSKLVTDFLDEFSETIPIKLVSRENTYVISARLPGGISKKDIEVKKEGHALTISMKKNNPPNEQGDEVLIDDFGDIRLSRTITFKGGVLSDDEPVAKVTDGMLTIVLTKSKDLEAKTIPIE